MKFQFDNSYARSLAGFYSRGEADQVPFPQLVRLNRSLAAELNLDVDALDSPLGAQIFSGNQPPDDAEVLAQAYAGHQFGHFVPQLGDGRAVLYGEVIDRNGRRRDIQLKGSGRTPFSRGGDGKAAVGPVLREYIIGEAMHALGIPTTRALAAVTTGQPIFRNAMLPGAVLTRVAASHIRVGTFQFFAARQDTAKLRLLADYSIQRHYPGLAASPHNKYLDFLTSVCASQATLIARWMHVGFIHGVMNTDNMTISGETIDYGPCAFMEAYRPTTVFSSIDHNGRYAYGEQPSIARWNLARFAECLLPLLHDDDKTAVQLAVHAVNHFTDTYFATWFAGMRAKLGLSDPPAQDDLNLVNSFLALLEQNHADYTNAFRGLTRQEEIPFLADWLPHWRDRNPNLAAMNAINPLYIARNHKVEEALTAATDKKDYTLFEQLLSVLEDPFTERPGLDSYTQPAPPSTTPYKTFCGT